MAADYLFTGMTFLFVMGFVFMLLGFENRDTVNPHTALNVVAYHFLASIVFFLLGQLFLMAYSSATTFVLPLWMWFFGLGLLNFAFFMVLFSRVVLVAWQRRQGIEREDVE